MQKLDARGITALCLLGAGLLGARSPARAEEATTPSPRAVAAGSPAAPTENLTAQPPLESGTFTVVGYKAHVEYMQEEGDWRRYLGPVRYRQSVASRVLTIGGGAMAFAGATSLLVGLGNLASHTDYGQRVASGTQPDFQPYLIGFSVTLATGGALLITGLGLGWALPSRLRPFYQPQLQPVPQPPPAQGPPRAQAAGPQWAVRGEHLRALER